MGEFVDRLRRGTRKPAGLVERGVDAALFNPYRRTQGDAKIVFGHTWHLSTEKNLRLLKRVEDALRGVGNRDYWFDVIDRGLPNSAYGVPNGAADLSRGRGGACRSEVRRDASAVKHPADRGFDGARLFDQTEAVVQHRRDGAYGS